MGAIIENWETSGIDIANPSVDLIAGAVWDEPRAGHTGSDTAGLMLWGLWAHDIDLGAVPDGLAPLSVLGQMMCKSGTTPLNHNYDRATDSQEAIRDYMDTIQLTAEAIADAVWDEGLVAAHGSLGTAGLLLSMLTQRGTSGWPGGADTWATGIDPTSVLGQMAETGDTDRFDQTTDSLQAISVDIAAGVDVVSIDGELTSGNNATLNLKQLNIVNSAGDALVAQSTGSNGRGIHAIGDGTGDGIFAVGGNDATTGGRGIRADGGTGVNGGEGILTRGLGDNASSIRAEANGTGAGLAAIGGSSGGDGFAGIGSTTGAGMRLAAGLTGHGLETVGGGTSGDGINASATVGDGIQATGAGGGFDINADIQGALSGAVGSVTGDVGGNVTGTIGGLTAGALADFFDTDSGTTYSSAVAGSVVKEIADNAAGAGAPTASEIADAVWNELETGHDTASTFGLAVIRMRQWLTNRERVNDTTKQLERYDDVGTGVIYSFDLKDSAGAPSTTSPYEKVPV
jgi:hypothetical protein